jgi:alkenylglycerophosphocholine hydrolase
MTSAAGVCLVLAALAAVGDWVAVHVENKRLEYACKPLTMVFLVGVAASLDVDSSSVRAWIIVALVLSMLGDVFLMLPRDAFIAGLVSFLLAHVAYVVGLWDDGVTLAAFGVGVVLAGVAVAVVGSRIIRAVRASEHPDMAVPVAAYMTVISLMVASAVGTVEPLAIGGASLFFCSDAMIAWERFVRPQPWHRLAIIVTYHLAQAGLTLSLLT